MGRKTKFKVGDEVIIRRDSKYYRSQGHYGKGKIDGIDTSRPITWYRVSFEDKYSNSYENCDLRFYKILNWREKIETGKKD